MAENGLVGKNQLDADDVRQLREIEAVCLETDGYRVKFNWEMMAGENLDHVNHFLYYDAGRLVGYTPLDGFGASFEMTCAVLPGWRRRGIGGKLLHAARCEAEQHCGSLLLVSYRASAVDQPAEVRWGAPYTISEFRMEAHLASRPVPPLTELLLVEMDESNALNVSRLLAVSFGEERSRKPEALLTEVRDDNIRYYLAMLGGIAIGQAGVVIAGDEVYIRAVGIVPDRRHRGYGRQLLAMIVSRMYAAGYRRFSLDVETENGAALSIYESCGFRAVTIYDYYKVR